MSGYFQRLAERALGSGASLQPVSPSRYAPSTPGAGLFFPQEGMEGISPPQAAADRQGRSSAAAPLSPRGEGAIGSQGYGDVTVGEHASPPGPARPGPANLYARGAALPPDAFPEMASPEADPARARSRETGAPDPGKSPFPQEQSFTMESRLETRTGPVGGDAGKAPQSARPGPAGNALLPQSPEGRRPAVPPPRLAGMLPGGPAAEKAVPELAAARAVPSVPTAPAAPARSRNPLEIPGRKPAYAGEAMFPAAPARASSAAAEANAPAAVRIQIGRIEIRAAAHEPQPASRPRKSGAEAKPALGLTDYLKSLDRRPQP